MRIILFEYGADGSYIFPRVSALDRLGEARATTDFVMTPVGGYDPNQSDDAQDRPQILTVQREIVVNTPTELQTALDAARSLRGKTGKLWALTYDGHWRWLQARSNQITETRTNRNFNWQPLTYIFDAANGYWRGHDHTGWLFDDGEDFDDGLYLDDDGFEETMASSPHIITVTNGGNRIVTDAVITVTAGGANITALTIAAGDAEFSFSGAIAAGEALVIDTGAYSVLNNGADAFASFSLTANHSIDEWLIIDADGDTDITVTFTGGSTDSTVLVRFADRWY